KVYYWSESWGFISSLGDELVQKGRSSNDPNITVHEVVPESYWRFTIHAVYGDLNEEEEEEEDEEATKQDSQEEEEDDYEATFQPQ
ncbi:hypothetical protein Gotri_018986, partial [Gossypium trilobum]|nr:hypothetical protein [Gossypium trilobum]